MSTHRPEMRASQLQANVKSFACLGSENERLVRERCSEVVSAVEGAIRTAWLPLGYGIEMVQVVEDICGREMASKVARRAIARSMRGSLLGPILRGLVRLGLGPEHALKRAPAGWGLVYKSCGNVTYTSKPDHVTLHLQGVPEEMRSIPYRYGLAASFEEIVSALGGKDAKAAFHDDAADIVFEIRWK